VPPSLQGCLAVLVCALSAAACARQNSAEPLILATTTSVGNSGLLDALLPAFERAHCQNVRSHLVGSGLALRMLANRDADLVISHAPEAEAEALCAHRAWRYRKVMFNALWQSAGIRPPAGRLVVAGAAMGATLRIASETESYSLSDRGTFLPLENSLRLVIVYENGLDLLNTYSVIVDTVGGRVRDAQRFSDWLADGEGRRVVEGHRVDGRQMFFAWPTGRPADRPDTLSR
jgi:tungstate transport system substrate-binding protein